MLPGWLRPAGGCRTVRRQPGKHRRVNSSASIQRNANSARHGDTGTRHSNRPSASHDNGHPGPNRNANPDKHPGADAVRDRNGEPDANARNDAVGDSIGDSHAASNADRNPNSERNGPGSKQHAAPDRNNTTAYPHRAAGHPHACAAHPHPHSFANETSPGVDLAS